MNYKIVKKEEFLLVGLSVRTTNKNQQAIKDIKALWEEFMVARIPEKLSEKTSNSILCAYLDYESDFTGHYNVVIGCSVRSFQELPSEVTAQKKIPAAKYAVFTIEGDYPQSLIKAWQWIWASDLKRTYTGDFEVYPPGFLADQKKKFEIYVAVQ